MQYLMPIKHADEVATGLRYPESIDQNGILWLKASETEPRTRAWVAHHIDRRLVERAMAAGWPAVVQKLPAEGQSLVLCFARQSLDDNASKPDLPQQETAKELILGRGEARLFVEEGVLYITAPAIVSRAEGRHRILGGSLELG